MSYSVRRQRTIRGLQPSYISVITDTALQAIRAKIAAARNPFATYMYAEALDALIAILPPEVKKDLSNYDVDVDTVLEEARSKCRPDPDNHPYVNTVQCLRLIKRDLDKLIRIVFDLAHRRGLFLLEREVIMGSE